MGKRVIYVNPVSMASEKWDLYQKDTKARLVAGEEINNLVSRSSLTHFFFDLSACFRQLVPLSRHSTLPELQSFVKLFRPKRIVPNTLDPRLQGLDWTCIDKMFSHCLHPSAQALPSNTSSSQLRLGVTGRDRLTVTVDAQNDVDVALKNLVGDGAADAAQRWADHGRLLKKVAVVRDYLGDGVVDKLLSTDRSTRPVSGKTCSDPPKERSIGDKGKGKETSAARYNAREARYYARESEEDTTFGDSDDERGKTAHKLFSSLAGIDEEDKENTWWISSPSSKTAEQNVDISQELLNAGDQGRGEPVGNGAWRLNRLTPVASSLVRAPTNKSGSKFRSVTPRQSQLGGSVRKRVAAKNKASPSTPRTPIPSRSIMRSTGAVVGAGHSLASPICLLSSSPDVPVQGRRQTSEQIKPSGGLSHVAQATIPKHHSLNSIPKVFKSTPATNSMGIGGNTLIRETTLKVCDRQIENIASSSGQHVVLDTTLKCLRKHLTDEGPSFTPVSSKKRRRAASTVDPQPGVTLHETVDEVAVSSKEAMDSNQETRICSEDSTERERLALKRMDIAQQLANNYPHLVAPSYEKKRAKQLAKLKEKERGRAGAGGATGSDAIVTRQKLVHTRTILSFETVDDDDGGMDWNRSKQLTDDLRDAVANGRKPVLPSLKCALSN